MCEGAFPRNRAGDTPRWRGTHRRRRLTAVRQSRFSEWGTFIRAPWIISRKKAQARLSNKRLEEAAIADDVALARMPSAFPCTRTSSGSMIRVSLAAVAGGFSPGAGVDRRRACNRKQIMHAHSHHREIVAQYQMLDHRKGRVPVVPVTGIGDGNSRTARRRRDISLSSRRSRRSCTRVRLLPRGAVFILSLYLTNEGNNGNSRLLPASGTVVSAVPVSRTADGNRGNSEVVE